MRRHPFGGDDPRLRWKDDPELDKLRRWMEAHELSLAEAKSYKFDTLDLLEPLARIRVPVIHVCGDADESVPFEQHTAEFARRYKELAVRSK